MLLTNSGVVELLETQGIFNSAMLLDIAKRIIWCLCLFSSLCLLY
jgi:hypothetical protein